jgi:tetratricopeptide (TPR) repeat protein
VATLKTLAYLRVEDQDYAEGIQFLERALQANPLDAMLRQRLSTTHLFQARAFAEANRFDDARAEFRLVLSLNECNNSALLCKMAACEFKAGDEVQAEDYLHKALAVGSHLSVAFSMLIEVIRLKLPGKLKTRFNKDFNALLKEPADGATAVALAENAAAHRAMGVHYHGQKTHEKKVLGYMQKASAANLAELQLEKICEALLTLRSRKLLLNFAQRGRRRFPQNPYFPFWQAETFIMQGPYRCPSYRVRPLLDEVRRLAAAMPPGSRKEQLLEEVKRREEMISTLHPLGGFDFDRFNDLLDQYYGDEDDD